jgi:hypothetical protein
MLIQLTKELRSTEQDDFILLPELRVCEPRDQLPFVPTHYLFRNILHRVQKPLGCRIVYT